MSNVFKSWRTALSGISAFVVVLFGAVSNVLDNDPNTVANWNLVVAAAVTMIGLITARDNQVSSKQAGVT